MKDVLFNGGVDEVVESLRAFAFRHDLTADASSTKLAADPWTQG